jgi:hypothetical protein
VPESGYSVAKRAFLVDSSTRGQFLTNINSSRRGGFWEKKCVHKQWILFCHQGTTTPRFTKH